jgi:prevent-host-death family protein
VTELRERLAEIIDTLTADQAVLVGRRSKPVAYLVSPAMFESLLV